MFEGFSPETADFLWGIRMNNDREWFQAHKQEYTHCLYEPMKELGQALFEPFRDQPGRILKVSRIYRDARLHHPQPYKESLWICIRRDVQWWAEEPCLFFEITPEGVEYGMVFWKPKAAVMEALRRQVTARPGEFLALVEQAQRAVGEPVTAQTYKRPRPCPSQELERFYQWKENICCTRKEPFGDGVFSGELARRVRQTLVELAPLTDYLCGLVSRCGATGEQEEYHGGI